MATRNWVIANDASVLNGAYGNTVDQHHPVGLWIIAPDAYVYRAYMKFTLDLSSMITITSAVLWMRSTSESHVGRGSSRTIRVLKLTQTLGNTQGGSSEGSWSASASPHAWLTATTTDEAPPTAMTNSDNTWDTVDITDIAQAWLAGGTNYGIEVLSSNEGTEANTWEFYSKDSSYDPYIVVTYTTNVVPVAPTTLTPTGGTLTTLTPTFAFTHSDPDGDACASYDIEVDNNSDFSSPLWSLTNSTTGIVGNAISKVYAGSALSRGTTYYWRARTNDGTGDGEWSAGQSFKVQSLPTVTITEPSATGRLGKLSYTAGSGWAAPRLNLAWNFGCVDGGSQSTYEVEVYNDTAGAVGSSFYDSGPVASVVTSLVVPTTLVEGNYYHVRAQVKCSHNETSAFTGYFRFRTRWGASSHTKNLGSVPSTWAVATLDTTSVLGSSDVVVEYNGSTNGTSVGTWMSSLSSVTVKQWVHYRVWMLAYGASPVTTPSLNQLVVNYTATVLSPDKWTREDSVNSYASNATYVYGTQSLQHTGDGGLMRTYQQVTVTPDTDYVLSARIKTLGVSLGQVFLATAPTTGFLIGTTPPAGSADWARYSTVVWNSGSNTSVYVVCYSDGAAGTYAWFDAIKMEASLVVTPWVPGFVGTAVTLDAGGIQIDGAAGGVFRLRGSTGGTRDRVDGGANGLKFGGDTDVYSASVGVLNVNGGAQPATLSLAGGSVVSEGAQIDIAETSNQASPGVWHIDTLDKTLRIFRDAVVVAQFTGGATPVIDFKGFPLIGKAAIPKVYDASSTWTNPANLHGIMVEVWGGGGAGGGTALTAASQCAAGAGGSGGGYSRVWFSAAQLAGAASFTVTVGAAGTPGAAGANAGGAGGTSSFSGTGITTCQATGGGGGGGSTAVANTGAPVTAAASAVGVGSNGHLNLPGSVGGHGRVVLGECRGSGWGGSGAASGGGAQNTTSSGGGAGTAGLAPGGGGSGASAGASVAAGRQGGAGGAGRVVVTEFYGP